MRHFPSPLLCLAGSRLPLGHSAHAAGGLPQQRVRQHLADSCQISTERGVRGILPGAGAVHGELKRWEGGGEHEREAGAQQPVSAAIFTGGLVG